MNASVSTPAVKLHTCGPITGELTKFPLLIFHSSQMQSHTTLFHYNTPKPQMLMRKRYIKMFKSGGDNFSYKLAVLNTRPTTIPVVL